MSLVLNFDHKIYHNNSINEETINHLEILGLVYRESGSVGFAG